MIKEKFLFSSKPEQIQNSFIKEGWVTIYEAYSEGDERYLIYPYLVDAKNIKEDKNNTNWKIEPDREGKPSIISHYSKGKNITKYYTYPYEGFEPFIFVKNFSFADGDEDYVDISEEFVLYYQLYEKGENKQNRTFYFIDSIGDFDEVIKIESNKVKVKQKYLVEYISVRKMSLTVGFHFISIAEGSLNSFDIQPQDENFQAHNYIYSHYVDDLASHGMNKVRSALHGKAFINFDKRKSETFYFDNESEQYEKFITGYGNDGDLIYEICKDTIENAFKLTYFKKEVLNKYLNEPGKYEVDGWTVRSKFFILKIDNNIDDYVAVFLGDLSSLPIKEQLHWKHHNIRPQKGISNAYYQTMIEGRWVDAPETPDLYFKYKYKEFNRKWEEKFGWRFYKKLAKEDEHNFISLHIPITNNVKAFCEQILSIVKITIDRLNEAEFTKHIELEENDKGLTKLEKFLSVNKINIPEMMEFLRNLQNLRSGLVAHSFSQSNKGCKKAMEYFKINEMNYIEVGRDIFIKSIRILNTLESFFHLDKSDE